jgi:hypothetical protein
MLRDVSERSVSPSAAVEAIVRATLPRRPNPSDRKRRGRTRTQIPAAPLIFLIGLSQVAATMQSTQGTEELKKGAGERLAPKRATSEIPAAHDDHRDRLIFARTRLILLPSFVFHRYLASYSNALCRPHPGAIAQRRGINRSDACNGSVEAGVRWHRDGVWFELSGLYAKIFMPSSSWVAQGEQLAAADLTEIKMHVSGIQVGILREYSLGHRLPRWSWHLGGQLGFAKLFGHIYRTKLGAQPETCTWKDLGNLERCRPFRAVEFNEPERDPRFFASCTKDKCDPHDLERAGRSREELPAFIPWIAVSTGPAFRVSLDWTLRTEIGLGPGYFFGIGAEYRLAPLPVPQRRIPK